ncbi:hypothetical protein M514_11840 [Trichuris suis]|uniref:Uncharacterized protein n=1 Tax=Trichuris suis TaxID=68888 RepID=A0A085MSS6_9BILA|nr:hypothetical protein M514_11840 [Trichuris suis]
MNKNDFLENVSPILAMNPVSLTQPNTFQWSQDDSSIINLVTSKYERERLRAENIQTGLAKRRTDASSLEAIQVIELPVSLSEYFNHGVLKFTTGNAIVQQKYVIALQQHLCKELTEGLADSMGDLLPSRGPLSRKRKATERKEEEEDLPRTLLLNSQGPLSTLHNSSSRG